MKFSLLVLIALLALPLQAIQVDKQQLRYWLEKRAGRALSDYEARQQISDYISGLGRFSVRVPFNGRPPEEPTLLRGYQGVSGNSVNGAKILAILVDFPDLPHDDNRLVQSDSDMFYPTYPVSHYEQLVFSEQGFKAPDGQILMSAYQYYQLASGGSFSLTGEAYGWVTVGQNAQYYGQRVGVSRDINVASLVKEAVELAVSRYDINLSEYDLTDLNDLDGDGIINEPDGVVDHIMLFHSSIGEEAGGGALGTDAIWSHRFVVSEDGYTPVAISNSDVRIHNYTVNPIDASVGVVVHEFGHELGLLDEYDLSNGNIGEPVANWSVMSNGNWLGPLRGSQPVSFSPRNLERLQAKFGGNWVIQNEMQLVQLTQASQVALNHIGEYTGKPDQLKVNLPVSLEYIGEPINGKYQYYSGQGNAKISRASVTMTLPDNEELRLVAQARFDIEDGYDFFQAKINEQPLAGNFTKAQHPIYPSVSNYIDGDSGRNEGGSNGSKIVELVYPLTEYSGQTVTLELLYQTDNVEYGFGVLLDDITVYAGENVLSVADAESPEQLSLTGFSRIASYRAGLEQAYYLQLRSHLGIDTGLQGASYAPGVLVWYGNENVENNSVSLHPGKGKILVVDTDQLIIPGANGVTPAATRIQLRDAAMRVHDQPAGLGDNRLQAVSEFNDSQDYSHPQQPLSGVVLPENGLSIEVLEVGEDYRNAQLQISVDTMPKIHVKVNDLSVGFSVSGLVLNTTDTFEWQFGDGMRSELLEPEHQFQGQGVYKVIFTRTNESGETQSIEQQVTIAAPLVLSGTNVVIDKGSLAASVQFQGGANPVIVSWELGDGTILKGSDIKHQYRFSGRYLIVVTLEDANGSKVSKSIEESVVVPLSGKINVVKSGLTTDFALLAQGGSGNYEISWAFGDGQTGSGASVSHSYDGAGSYQVSATLTDLSDNQQVVVSADVTLVESTGEGQGGSAGGLLALSILMLVMTGTRKRPA
ncbi:MULTISPECIES: immune inhibitor A domain-containing protein [unclassified Pseudoalteromonas]|uniref:immune inhibitor A domain-containing protein n=1 Tax=unclassified Pseudoalteromonas TaxID=194690 RepID=UPI002097DF5E|nr:immune inhibitor A domain-containing protein [Pseudoalteromonas sp. XMcav2-N]MCO7187679.1 immune inhibitor A [Pseudoalteromonas sp. XMcav2-N]